jgi:DNA polymerase-3 subunit delta'
MKFSEIIGNEDVKRALAGMVDSGRIPHAMMFYENDGCGALQIILAFLQYLYCKNRSGSDSCGACGECNKIAKLIHPDIHFVFPVTGGSKVSSSEKPTSNSYIQYWRKLLLANPFFLENELNGALGIEGKSSTIAVPEAKAILESLSLTSVEGGYSTIVLYLPEKMNPEAANRLLKIIEEPPEKTLFLMITHYPEKVLQTISSRCQGVRIMPLSREEIASVLTTSFGKDSDQAAQAALMAHGSVGTALHYLADQSDYKDNLDLFSDLMNSLLSKDLQASLEVGETIAALDSREKQKAFCKFAGECLRKIFFLQQNVPGILGIASEELPFFQEVAAKSKRTFCRNAMTYLDRAQLLIERNVNQKILFCDMVNRMFVKI